MSKEKTKVYLYTRVSTLIQVDGYSLDAQKSKMKAFCEYNEYEIAGEYEDAGKSGKSTEGRVSFNRMMDAFCGLCRTKMRRRVDAVRIHTGHRAAITGHCKMADTGFNAMNHGQP